MDSFYIRGLRGEEHKEALSGPVRTYHISELGGEEYVAKLEAKANKGADTSPKNIDKDKLLRLVLDERMSIAEAARELGVTHGTVIYHLKEAVKRGEARHLGGGEYARPAEVQPQPKQLAEPAPASETTPTAKPENVNVTENIMASTVYLENVQRLQQQFDVLARSVDELWSRIERMERGSDFIDQLMDVKRDLQRLEETVEHAETITRFLNIIERLLSRMDGGVSCRAG